MTALPESKVSDGASLRKRRILALLAYVKGENPRGASVGDLQSFMLAKFGLRYDTTSKMVQELHVGGWLTLGQEGRWYTTAKTEKLAGWLYGEE